MSVPKPEPRIAAFEKMAYGMFVHWGVSSQLGRGEWIKNIADIPDEEYDGLLDTFTAENFDADKIVSLAAKSGMKYVTLITRHHDGFSLYDAKGVSDYDALHTPAKRDFVREFVDACAKNGVAPFFYHTTLDWHNKDFNDDFDAYLKYLNASVEILCTRYGKIGGFWFDGNWSRPDADWKLDDLYGLIRKYQPEAMIINNTGIDARGEIIHPEIDAVTFEQGAPRLINRDGAPKYVSSETCRTLNGHWGFAKNDFNYIGPAEVIKILCACRRAGSNLLLNIGPDASGAVPPMMEAILGIVGEWIGLYGDAVYDVKPCGINGAGEDFGLKSPEGRTFLFVFDLPGVGNENDLERSAGLEPRSFTGVYGKVKAVKWLDAERELPFAQNCGAGLLSFRPTGYGYGVNTVARVAEVFFE